MGQFSNKSFTGFQHCFNAASQKVKALLKQD